ncbi:MAG: membrane protein [Gammaproteobacteria bacterium]|nr:MAG: membrane protein [Gammaproteobacteria bacterium]
MSGIFSARWIRIYLVPGAVFQSVMIGGGYGTGREIVEYFTRFGFLGGALGLGIAYLLMAGVLALTFELSRVTRTYDYRNFFKQLLGRGWVAYEVLVILGFLLILAVLASAAGNILRDNLRIPYFAGIAVMLACIGVLTFYGRELIAKVLTFWSLFLYVVFLTFFVVIFAQAGDTIQQQIAHGEIIPGWAKSGLKYGAYNISMLPLLLFVARGFESRREATVSGLIAAAIALIPGAIFHVAFLAAYPAILEQSIPVYWMLGQFGFTALVVIYSIMLFGTFIETGAGLLQGINDRLDAYRTEITGQGFSRLVHAGVAVAAVSGSALLSLVGITALIAHGYGAVSWAFLLVYILPLATVGLRRIVRQ